MQTSGDIRVQEAAHAYVLMNYSREARARLV